LGEMAQQRRFALELRRGERAVAEPERPACAPGFWRPATVLPAIRREIALLTFRDAYRGAMGRPIISMRASMIFSSAPTIAAALSPKPLAARSFTSSFRMAA
jgi:hypothetical protein